MSKSVVRSVRFRQTYANQALSIIFQNFFTIRFCDPKQLNISHSKQEFPSFLWLVQLVPGHQLLLQVRGWLDSLKEMGEKHLMMIARISKKGANWKNKRCKWNENYQEEVHMSSFWIQKMTGVSRISGIVMKLKKLIWLSRTGNCSRNLSTG